MLRQDKVEPRNVTVFIELAINSNNLLRRLQEEFSQLIRSLSVFCLLSVCFLAVVEDNLGHPDVKLHDNFHHRFGESYRPIQEESSAEGVGLLLRLAVVEGQAQRAQMFVFLAELNCA